MEGGRNGRDLESPHLTLCCPGQDLWELPSLTSASMLSPHFTLGSLPLLPDGLLFLAEKIQGPFSFELAAQAIGVKISEGLMYLQENSVGVSTKVQEPPGAWECQPGGREEWCGSQLQYGREQGLGL